MAMGYKRRFFPTLVFFFLVTVHRRNDQFALAGGSQVTVLPGFPGPLPFYLETGYIGVDEGEDVQLFYHFVKSKSNPEKDPLMLWLLGGPGCSSLSSLLVEIGPLFIDREDDEQLPTLSLHPHSYAEVANIIYLDLPVGTGFSYARTPEAAHSTGLQSCGHVYEFVRKWLADHMEFISNPFYVAGNSYVGITIPVITQLISNGNAAGINPRINLKGYMIGNPGTFPDESNYRIPFAHGMGLISDELYESLKQNCEGNYKNVNASNLACLKDIQTFKQLVDDLFEEQILETKCETPTPKYIDKQILDVDTQLELPINNQFLARASSYCEPRYIEAESNYLQCPKDVHNFNQFVDNLLNGQVLDGPHPNSDTKIGKRQLLDHKRPEPHSNKQYLTKKSCHTYKLNFIDAWASDPSVQEALYVRKGTGGKFVRCNDNIPHTDFIWDSIPYHVNLSAKGYTSLIYSGDHDMVVPFQSTQAWIRSLNYSVVDEWRPWFVGGLVAGYTRTYANNMTFATVKGGSHTPSVSNPEICTTMFKRWVSHQPL